MENNFNDKSRNEGRIAAGLILVLVGTGWLLRNTGFPLPEWLFTWPMILILVGVYSGFKHNFRNNSWFILIGIGLFFLFDKFIPGITLQPYFWPVAIIVLGIIFILRPNGGSFSTNRKQVIDGDTNITSTGQDWQSTGAASIEADGTDALNISSIFSGVNKNIMSKNFQGGKISCVFGGADIDLTKTEISGKVIIRLEVVFGGVKLILPPHWTVLNEVDGVFHGIDDKRKYNPATVSDPDKVVILKGSVVFGGVEIKSY